MTIEFGAEIEVNGVRPKWLADDDQILVRWDRRRGVKSVPGAWSPLAIDAGTKSERDWRWDTVFALCLPADHFAYIAIERGFEPWGGGNRVPEDWDGAAVLAHDTSEREPRVLERPFPDNWSGTRHHVKIIGYRKTPVTQQPTDQALTIRITGPQGSGKTRWAEMLRDLIPAMTKIGFPVPVVVDAGEEG